MENLISITIYNSKVFNVISDERSKTVCPLILKEPDMIAGNCKILDVYAEQYGMQGKKKTYTICYYGKL